MDVSVEIHCAACGSANYSVPDGAADAAPVRCNDCGRDLGSVAELKSEIMDQVMAHSAEGRRAEVERLRPGGSGGC